MTFGGMLYLLAAISWLWANNSQKCGIKDFSGEINPTTSWYFVTLGGTIVFIGGVWTWWKGDFDIRERLKGLKEEKIPLKADNERVEELLSQSNMEEALAGEISLQLVTQKESGRELLDDHSDEEKEEVKV